MRGWESITAATAKKGHQGLLKITRIKTARKRSVQNNQRAQGPRNLRGELLNLGQMVGFYKS